LPLRALRAQVASAINILVQIERMRDGVRRVERICEISGMEGEIISTRDIFTFKFQGERGGRIEGAFERAGCAPISLLVPRSTDSSGSCSKSVGITAG